MVIWETGQKTFPLGPGGRSGLVRLTDVKAALTDSTEAAIRLRGGDCQLKGAMMSLRWPVEISFALWNNAHVPTSRM